MFSNWEVCNRFVTQQGYHAAAGNLRFEGNALISYRTEIARMIDGVLYYSLDTMTSTTAHHVWGARRAANLHGIESYAVKYERGDSFFSNKDMLRTTYSRMLDDLVQAINPANPRSTSLRYQRNRRWVRSLLEATIALHEKIKAMFPAAADIRPLTRAIKKILRETKANRRRWRSGDTGFSRDLIAVVSRAIDPNSDAWLSKEDLQIRERYAHDRTRMESWSLYDCAKAMHELRGPNPPFAEDRIERHAYTDAVQGTFSALLANEHMAPFYLKDGRTIHEIGVSDSIPCAIFRRMESARQLNLRSTSISMTASYAGYLNRLQLVLDGPGGEITRVQLNGFNIGIELYETIVRLIKEEDEYGDTVEFTAD